MLITETTIYGLKMALKVGVYAILALPLLVLPGLTYPYVFPKVIFFQIFIELLLAIYLFLIIVEPKIRPKFSWLNVAVSAFLFFYIISTIFAVDRLTSFWGGLEWHNGLFLILHLGAFFLILSSFSKKEFLPFLKFSMVVGFIVCLSALSQRLGLFFNLPTGGRVYGLLGNPAFLSSYLLFHLFIAIFLLIKGNEINWRIFCGFNVVLNLIIFFMSQTRGAFLGLAAGLFFGAACYFLFYVNSKYRRLTIIILILIVIIVSVLMFFIFNKLQNDPNRNRNIMTRLYSWQITLDAWLDKFFFGWGAENFYVAFNQYFNPKYLNYSTSGGLGYEAALNFCHNKIIDTGLAHGLFGLLAYLSIFVAAFLKLFKSRHENQDLLIFGGLLVAYFVNNLFLFDYIVSFIMFYFILAYINAKEVKNEENFNSKKIKTRWFILWLIILTGLLWLIKFGSLNPLIDSRRASLAWQYQNNGQIIEAINAYQKTFQRHSYVTDKVAEDLNRLAIRVIRSNPENKKALDFYAFSLNEIKIDLERHRSKLSAYLQLGELLNAGRELFPENMKKAEEIQRQTIAMAPRRPEIYIHLGQTLLYQEKNEEALRYLRQAVDLNPDFYVSRVILARAYEFLEKTDDAMMEFDKAVRLGFIDNKVYKKLLDYYIKKQDLEKISYYQNLLKEN